MGGPAARAADASPEQQLADRYAPVVALKEQSEPCGSDGEPYRPIAADLVLGRRDVRLVDSKGDPIKDAPTAADLFGRDEDTYLDLPGETLDPGCSYEQWADTIDKGKPTTAYAHVVSERRRPGKLALQYWFYYPFNDWNNKHESDWEMVQLMFDASSASDALPQKPTEIGYSQHSGAERAAWGDDKLETNGTHPVVYPGRGSHANYFEQSIWLGHSAQEGFGCVRLRQHDRALADGAVPRRPPPGRNAGLRRRRRSPGSATTATGDRRRAAPTPARPGRTRRTSGPGRSPGARTSGGRAARKYRSSRPSVRARRTSSAEQWPRARSSTCGSCARPGRSWPCSS